MISRTVQSDGHNAFIGKSEISWRACGGNGSSSTKVKAKGIIAEYQPEVRYLDNKSQKSLGQ